MKYKSIPVELLERINEHTGGGFILFYVDRDGRPDWKTFMDNETLGRGLMSYIEDTLDSIRELEKIERISQMTDDLEEETDGEL